MSESVSCDGMPVEYVSDAATLNELCVGMGF